MCSRIEKSEETPAYCKPCHDYGDHRHEFYENVEAGTGCVLERVADGVAYNCGFMNVATFASEVGLLRCIFWRCPKRRRRLP